jgi:hypothetical protein
MRSEAARLSLSVLDSLGGAESSTSSGISTLSTFLGKARDRGESWVLDVENAAKPMSAACRPMALNVAAANRFSKAALRSTGWGGSSLGATHFRG